MSNTSSLNVINIQIRAEDQRRLDNSTPSTSGEYANLAQENEASDSKYYLWHGDHEAIPMGLGALKMNGQTGEVDEAATTAHVQRYVKSLAEAVPQANTLRIPFNENNFHPDGSMDIRFEAFLEEASAQGFQIILGYFGGDAQGHGFSSSSTADDIYDDLSGRIYGDIHGAWSGMLDWLDAHPSVKNAIYGLELANEPAGYAKGASSDRGGDTARFVELYTEHVNALADLIDARADSKILVGGWAYSAHFDVFAETMINGVSALDLIRQSVGDDLVWSAHFYGGWHGNRDGSTRDDYLASFERVFGSLGNDDILVTEMNARGTSANNWAIAEFNHFVFSRAAEWFAENGIGISWFPGVQSGASGLVVISGNGTPEYRHPDSFAIANHLFSTDETPLSGAGNDTILADRIDIRSIRNENMNVDSNGDGVPDSGSFNLDVDDVDVGIAFGYEGNDRITGHDAAWDFLYGGHGSDTIHGHGGNDFLFGQHGNDVVVGGDGDDKLFGNQGNDTLNGSGGNNQLEGGDGADIFHIMTDGINVIVDFDEAEGDRIIIDGTRYTLEELEEIGTRADGDLQGRANDVLIQHSNGAITLILNVLNPHTVTVHGTDGSDNIVAGFIDRDGNSVSRFDELVYAGAGNDTVRADWGDDIIYGETGNDILSGGRGNDSLNGGAGNDHMVGDSGNDYLAGGDGDDKVAGGDGDDVLFGDGGSDDIIGNAGNDILHDGAGKDNLTGGMGADIFKMAAGDGQQDRIKDFYLGEDLIDVSAWGVTGIGALAINQRKNSAGFVTNEWIIDFESESIRINLRDVPAAQQGNNQVGAPNPFNADHFIFRVMNVINGTEGDDRQENRINGTSGHDEIFGHSGHDDLRGGAGDDVIHDGTGKDDLTGGTGADRFVLTGNDQSRDRIKDFALAEDRIDLSDWGGINDMGDLDITFRQNKSDELLISSATGMGDSFFLRIVDGGPDLQISDLTADHFIF